MIRARCLLNITTLPIPIALPIHFEFQDIGSFSGLALWLRCSCMCRAHIYLQRANNYVWSRISYEEFVKKKNDYDFQLVIALMMMSVVLLQATFVGGRSTAESTTGVTITNLHN